jgi:hypothetical protein
MTRNRGLKTMPHKIHNVVKVTQYLTRPEDIPAYSRARTRFLGDARPAFMLTTLFFYRRSGCIRQ